MTPPVSIHIRPYVISSVGLPTQSGYDTTPPHVLTSYSHLINDAGGEISASIQVSVAREGAQVWLDLVGAQLRAFDRHAEAVFNGWIETVEINDGARSYSRTLAGVYNRIQVQYTSSGKSRITTAATNSDSAQKFFNRTLIYNAGDMTSTQADTTRDQLASALAWPFENTVADLTRKPSRGQVNVALIVRGWTDALTWTSYLLKPNGATGTSISDTVLKFILNDSFASGSPSVYGNEIATIFAYADGITIDYTGPSIASGPGPLTSATPTREYETTLSVVQRIMAMGDSSGNRLSWGMNLFRYRGGDGGLGALFGAKVWAGDTPSAITYYARAPRDLLNSGFGPVPWTQARPNTMVAIIGGPVAIPRTTGGTDDNNRYYVKEVSYAWEAGRGETLRLAPEGNVDAAAVLARLR